MGISPVNQGDTAAGLCSKEAKSSGLTFVKSGERRGSRRRRQRRGLLFLRRLADHQGDRNIAPATLSLGHVLVIGEGRIEEIAGGDQHTQAAQDAEAVSI